MTRTVPRASTNARGRAAMTRHRGRHAGPPLELAARLPDEHLEPADDVGARLRAPTRSSVVSGGL